MVTMKKLIAAVLAAVMCTALFVGCNNNEDTGSNGSGTAKKKLIMATEAGFAPYEYLNGNEVVGIDVEIAKAIAEEMGMELEIQDIDFDGALLAVQNGTADFAAAGISITDDRKEKMDFTIEYATSKQVVVVKKGDTSITKEDDLKEKIVGGQQGTTAQLVYDADDAALKPKKFNAYKKYSQAAADLKNGGIDCIVMDELPAKLLVAKNADLEIANAELFTDSYGMAIQKGNVELKETMDKVLQKLIDDGSIAKWTQEHSEAAL